VTPIIRIAAACALATTAVTPAHAVLYGSGTVDFTFTQFHGPFELFDGGFVYPGIGQVNGQTPVRSTDHLGALYNGTTALSGNSVSFGLVYDYPGYHFEDTANVITFTPIASFDHIARGVPFKVGTLTFTNGNWYGGFANIANNVSTFFDFTLTTHSATAEFNQVLNDSVKMTVNVGDCSAPGGAEDQADFISFTGGSQMGSLRVYDVGSANGACTPAGYTNTGSIDLYMKFNSLDYVGLRNPQGGFFSASAVPGPLGVPEPASWALLIAGFGLTGATLRGRRAPVLVAGATK
jgi:hypothetical protein